MKKKLTLTVEDEVVRYAKRLAKRQGKSVSQIFEELFQQGEVNAIQTEPQRAATNLLEALETSKNTKTKNDKQLIKKQIKRKFA